MSVKLLTEHQILEFLSLKGGYTGQSTHVKRKHCWKSHVMAHLTLMPSLLHSGES